MNSTAG